MLKTPQHLSIVFSVQDISSSGKTATVLFCELSLLLVWKGLTFPECILMKSHPNNIALKEL